MFKFFRKKKKLRVIKCSDFIKLRQVEGLENCYNITLSSYLQTFQGRVQTLLNEFHIYDDRIWVEAYREYQRHYKVYDRVPDLLLYKIPVLFAMSYPGIESRTDKEFAFRYYIPDQSFYEGMPSEFQLNPEIEDNFKSMYSKVYGYLPEGKVTIDEYIQIIRFNYYKNWDVLWNNPKAIRNYFDECMDIIMSFVDDECMVTVTNIITRCAEEMKEKLQTLKNNRDEQI
jgi:hypothetical protein